jgi:hypothetical protein
VIRSPEAVLASAAMRRPLQLVLVVTALAACGQSSATGPDGAAGDGQPGGDGAIDAPEAPGDVGDYRTSLTACWTDAMCPRVLAVAHGGSWDAATTPYDSNAALAAAFAAGDDGVKIDVRVTADNIPVIAHSSPIEIYESLDCANQKIEEMTAAQVTGCHRFPSSSENFQRLDDVLGYLRGRMVVQLCVKEAADYARTITEIHALGAEDFAFIEVANPGELATLIPTLPGADTVWYLVNVASQLAAIDDLLALGNPRAFMYEIDPGVAIGSLVADRLHPAGVRAFIYDDAASPTVGQLQAHYAAGFDAVSSQSGPKGVQARVAVNTARGVTPP